MLSVKTKVRNESLTDVYARSFILENRNGTRIDLLGEFNNTPFLFEPEGLGLGKSIETVQTTNLDVIKSIKDDRKDITGTFIFNSYAEYRVLAYFIEISQLEENILDNTQNCLKLYYQTVEEVSDEYFYIYFTDISKGEKEEDTGLLYCPFTARRVSNLRKDVVTTSSNVSGSAPYPTFPLPTEGSNFISFSNTLTGEVIIQIQNLSTVVIPVKLVLEGSFENPTWENRRNDLKGGYFLSSQGLDGTLIIDSNVPEKIELNGVDASNNQDMNKDNFLFLSPGTNEIVVTPTNVSIVGICTISIYHSEERGA